MTSGTTDTWSQFLLLAKAAARASCLSVIVFLSSNSAFADKHIGSAAALRSQILQIIESGPPGILLLIEDKELPLRMSAGIANIATKRKATTDDAWRIASVTKLVTAAIIMQLVQERRMKLSDPLSSYLPNSVRLADSISVKQLLNHTSGIPDYLAAPSVPLNVSAEFLSANLVRQLKTDRILEGVRSQRRRFKPGIMHEYSNTNYLLLGLIIEKVTGRSFPSVVSDRIIAPLRLKQTGFPDRKGNITRQHLRGYVPADLDAKPFSNRRSLIDVTTHDYFLGGDGGLYSTLDDTTRILRYVLNGKAIGRSLQTEMVSSMIQDHDGFYQYGLGVMAFTLPCGIRVYGHEGRDLGIYTVALFDPKRDMSFVFAANMSFEHEWGIQDRIDQIRNSAFCKTHINCSEHRKQ